MVGWQIGIIVVLVVGIAIIAYGMWVDRSDAPRRDRGSASTTEPRAVGDAETPASALARTPAPPDTAQREQADALMTSAGIDAAWATTDFANDGRGRGARCVLSPAVVLVCDGPVASARELWPALGRAQRDGAALVVVAPAFDEAASRVLIMNHRTDTVAALAVIADAEICAGLATDLGLELSTGPDRQSGYLPGNQWGHVATWVSDRHRSWFAS